MLVSLFNNRFFPVNIAKYLRTDFLQNISGGCFWTVTSTHFAPIILQLILLTSNDEASIKLDKTDIKSSSSKKLFYRDKQLFEMVRFHHQDYLDFVKHLINVYLPKRFVLIVNGSNICCKIFKDHFGTLCIKGLSDIFDKVFKYV